jgi:methyl-accepting chemotaxis protein
MKQWISNLSIARKFALIGGLAFGMAVVPTWVTVKSRLEEIRMTAAESHGLPPARELLTLVRLTQQHRGLTALALSGNVAAQAERPQKQRQVEQALQQLLSAMDKLEQPELSAELGAWESLTKAVSEPDFSAPRSYATHTALVERQLSLLERVAHASEMQLDSDPSLYYLINVSLTLAPQVSEALGRLRAAGVPLLAKGQASAEERARLRGLLEAARSYLATLERDFGRSVAAEGASAAGIAASFSKAKTASLEAFDLVESGILQPTELTMPAQDYLKATTRIIDTQFDFIDPAFDAIDAALTQRLAAAKRHLALVVALVLCAGLFGAWLMWTVARATSQALRRALDLARAVAAGDLRSEVGHVSRDEVGELLGVLGGMNGSLAQLVSAIRRSAESVSSGSIQIASGNADLSERTESQASNLQQTAASMEQLTATVRQNSESAHEAKQLAGDASQSAERGRAVVTQVVDTMQSISVASGRIVDITGVIDGLAFQTNILALNAAVEAARAGEHGRGFAVVAAEVRSLAQRSAVAAKEIKGLIDTSTSRVQAGSQLAAQAGTAMQDIVGRVGQVSGLIAQIHDASREQALGIAQVGQAVAQLDTVTQQNAALVEESAAAAESLRRQASGLTDLVSTFRIAPTIA